MDQNPYSETPHSQWNSAPGTQPPFIQPPVGSEPNFGSNVVAALLYFLTSLVYVLFVCPFSFWVAAVNRLATERANCRIDVIRNSSRWPYLSFCKRVFFEFAIDGFTFVGWFAGIIVAFIALISGFAGGLGMASFVPCFGILVGSYYLPVALALLRDLVMLLLLPFGKFLSWVSKPAQHLDIDMNKSAVER